MKNISDYLRESLEDEYNTEETIQSEEDFRAAARAKFEAVFGDELDEEQMNDTIEGLLNDHQDLVEQGRWGELIGILNKSFAN